MFSALFAIKRIFNVFGPPADFKQRDSQVGFQVGIVIQLDDFLFEEIFCNHADVLYIKFINS